MKRIRSEILQEEPSGSLRTKQLFLAEVFLSGIKEELSETRHQVQPLDGPGCRSCRLHPPEVLPQTQPTVNPHPGGVHQPSCS